jgi:hypothetical protein
MSESRSIGSDMPAGSGIREEIEIPIPGLVPKVIMGSSDEASMVMLWS